MAAAALSRRTVKSVSPLANYRLYLLFSDHCLQRPSDFILIVFAQFSKVGLLGSTRGYP